MGFAKQLTIYTAAGVIALVAFILNIPQLYWMTGTLMLIPQVGKFFAWLEQQGLEIERTVPPAAHQGDQVTVRYTLHNRFPLPKLHLTLQDELPAGLTRVSPEPVTACLAPRGTEKVEYQLRLGRRGVHTLSGTQVGATDLLGMNRRVRKLATEAQVLVYPRVVELPREVLPPEFGGGFSAVREAPRAGHGTSFYGIREYRPGDPLRHVHWRTAARWGRLAVVEWEAEESREAVIAIETGAEAERDIGAGSTLDLSAGLAASLAETLLFRGDAVRLYAPGAVEWRPSASRGASHLPNMLEDLARMQAQPGASLIEELPRLGANLPAGTLICWIAPAPSAELLHGVRLLLACRQRPTVFAMERGERGEPGLWDTAAGQLAAMQVPLIRLYRDDVLVHRLLD